MTNPGARQPTITMNRRQLLGGILGSFAITYQAACSADGTGRANSTISGASGRPTGIAGTSGSQPTMPFNADLHLLRRLTSAPTAQSIADLKALGADAWLDQQLIGTAKEPAELQQVLDQFDAALAVVDRKADPQLARQTIVSALAARTMLMSAFSANQLRETMVNVWADHLHVTSTAQPEAFFIYDYDTTLRTHALGKFSDLLIASAQSPAMLTFLDQARSRADGNSVPNENYARELLELHTLGVTGGYTETDVKNVAHVLSGWSLRDRGKQFVFRPAVHRLGPAEGADILGFTPSGAGETDGVDLLNHLARHASTARFVSWKIARRLIADDIDRDDPIIDEAAKEYSKADTSIAAVVKHLVTSDAFTSRPMSMFRRPLDHLAAMLRVSGSPSGKLDDRELRGIRGAQMALGQLAYGWPSPDGYPTPGAAWSNAGALISRWNVTNAIWQAKLPGLGLGDHLSVLQTTNAGGTNQDTPGAIAAGLARVHLGEDGSAELLDQVESILNTAADPTRPDQATLAAALTVISACPQFELR